MESTCALSGRLDGRVGRHTIEGSSAVLGRDADTAVNGGLVVDHAYGDDIRLGNGDDELHITFGTTVIDSVVYDDSAQKVLEDEALRQQYLAI